MRRRRAALRRDGPAHGPASVAQHPDGHHFVSGEEEILITERCVLFGSHGGLVGVLSEPAGSAPPPRHGVLFTNIGTHHRVGPFRLYVELARALANAGCCVLRFDHAAMGDSEPRPGSGDDIERIQADLSDAMAWLEKEREIQQFVVVGLCSGVTGAHNISVADARVKGAVFIDGYTFPTTGYYLRKNFTR